MKTKHFFCCLAIVVVCFSACEKEISGTSVPATDVTLNHGELALALGDTATLIAIVQPDSATNKRVTWTSSNTAVATVNSKGMVIAVANGKAIITATIKSGNLTDSCSVIVDYRGKWAGDWDFVEKIYGYELWAGQLDEWWDTIYYSGTIRLKGDNDLTIPSVGNVTMIGEGGEFVFMYGWDPFFGKFIGNNKMYLYYEGIGDSHGFSGGSRNIEGTRK